MPSAIFADGVRTEGGMDFKPGSVRTGECPECHQINAVSEKGDKIQTCGHFDYIEKMTLLNKKKAELFHFRDDEKAHSKVSRKKSGKSILREVKGRYFIPEFAPAYQVWMAKCPFCGERNMVDPQRSFRPWKRGYTIDRERHAINQYEMCIHFQQLKRPGSPSSFLFNPRAKTPRFNGVVKNGELEFMDRFHMKYLPGQRIASKDGKKNPAKREVYSAVAFISGNGRTKRLEAVIPNRSLLEVDSSGQFHFLSEASR